MAGIQQKRNSYGVLAWKLNERERLEEVALIWEGSDVDRIITCNIFSLGTGNNLVLDTQTANNIVIIIIDKNELNLKFVRSCIILIVE